MDCPDKRPGACSLCSGPGLLQYDLKRWVLQVPAVNMPTILKAALREPVFAPGLSLTTFRPGGSAPVLPRWAKIQVCQSGCSANTVLGQASSQ